MMPTYSRYKHPMFLAGDISPDGHGTIVEGEILSDGKIYVREIVDLTPNEQASRKPRATTNDVTAASAPPQTR